MYKKNVNDRTRLENWPKLILKEIEHTPECCVCVYFDQSQSQLLDSNETRPKNVAKISNEALNIQSQKIRASSKNVYKWIDVYSHNGSVF